jgi:hypothetical protein
MRITAWIIIAVFVAGFFAGFGLRSYFSHRRRKKARRRAVSALPMSHRVLTQEPPLTELRRPDFSGGPHRAVPPVDAAR